MQHEYRLADFNSFDLETVKSQRPHLAREDACKGLTNRSEWAVCEEHGARSTSPACDTHISSPEGRRGLAGATIPSRRPKWQQPYFKTASVLRRYAKFVGPGFMISVAYIDPGNYATDVAAGASYRFQLLFMILLSNIFAIFLQFLCIKLGSVTGLNLAEMSKAHFPRWLNYLLYFFAESAIIATDIAEVIGTAIALNLLLKVPLVAGCAISIVDVLVILAFYRPNGSMRGLRLFELFVALLVLGVVVCFWYQLSLIGDRATASEVFRGYAPSSALVEGKG
jgi:metal iron transporter